MKKAKAACVADADCKYVDDKKCDGAGPFQLCSGSMLLISGRKISNYDSCAWEKVSSLGKYHLISS